MRRTFIGLMCLGAAPLLLASAQASAEAPATHRLVAHYQEPAPAYTVSSAADGGDPLWTDAGEACRRRDCWSHRTGGFADFLYLQARGVDMVYAVPRDGVDPNTAVPVGAVGVADPDYEGAYRFGFNLALDRCSSLVASYTHFESSTTDGIAIDAPNVIHTLLNHPGTSSALSDGLSMQANYDIDFDILDLDYRRLVRGSSRHAVNYLLGVRYAQLDQELGTTLSRVSGDTNVDTEINFDGVGVRVGIDGERKLACGGLFTYGRALASILAGEFRSDYVQANEFAAVQANTSWEDDRVVPVLEYELGVGWENTCGTVRVSAGYYMAAWTNMVTTGEWIQGVQSNDFVDIGDTITFDGLTTRVEVRW